MTADILALAASGIALIPEAQRTLRDIYQAAPARFASAAHASRHRNARVLHAGRAETDRAAMQALGILEAGTDVEIRRLLRASLRAGYDFLSAIQKGSVFHLEWLIPYLGDFDADGMCARLYVALAICSFFGLTPQAGGEMAEFLQLILVEDGRGLEARVRPSKNAVCEASNILKNQCGQCAFSSWQDAADAFAPIDIDREIAALEHGGIDIGIYTSGVSCGQNDAPYIAGKTPRESFLLVTLLLLGRAIGRDKTDSLSAYRREDEAATAVDSLKAAQSRASALEARIAILEDELAVARKAAQRAQSEADSHAGDAQELAALREALWDGTKSEDPLPLEEKARDIPEKTIIIGGHPSWAREMEKSTGARAWPSGVTCPPQVIGSADEIWIQAAYMSHSEFFSVIDGARRLGKTVRYFPSTGVSRCLSAMHRKN